MLQYRCSRRGRLPAAVSTAVFHWKPLRLGDGEKDAILQPRVAVAAVTNHTFLELVLIEQVSDRLVCRSNSIQLQKLHG